MDIKKFESELRTELTKLLYVLDIKITRKTEISIKALIGLKKKYKLSVFYNETFYVISFSLIFQNQRIWAIDRDNRIGWHRHPLKNSSDHEAIEEMTINSIISTFDNICQQLMIHI